MSEFSESYHLRSPSRRDASSLLARAGLAGFVFPAQDGWVSFVAAGTPFQPNATLLAANEGLLLRWAYGEDHGWGFDLHGGTQRLLGYGCDWEDEIRFDAGFDPVALERALGLALPGLRGTAGRRIFAPGGFEQLFEYKPAYAFAAALGLRHYRWLSYAYLSNDAASGKPLPAGVLSIR
ncbi:hypothetical protein [Aquabacterium sp.]|uniref:hypothetical protein n=1 Tax=Aquabacterium sp. TaxID=1872578 RepID=UPI003784B929